MNKIIIAIIALVVIGGAYFLFQGGSGTLKEPGTQTPVSQNQEQIVSIRNHQITLPTLVISTGDTVTWKNEDNLAGFPYSNHSPTSGTIDSTGAQGQKGVVPNSGSGIADGTFELVLGSGKSQSFTFTEAGTYTYYIAEHPLVSGTGKIIVEKKNATVNMSARSFSFSPTELKAKVGENIVLDIDAIGTHTFTIDELDVNVPLPLGQITRVEFTPSQTGTFTYYCAIPGHRKAGQTGILKVE